MARIRHVAALVSALALASCAVAPPTGPRIVSLPGPNKTFAQFQQDDLQCRQYGQQVSGGLPAAQTASANATNAPIAGTAIGAAVGAAIGAAAGNPALGAAVGGGTGLLFGSASGAGQAEYSELSLQERYDIGYAQCMAANGNSVPPPGSPAYGAYYAYYGPGWWNYGPWWWGGGFVFVDHFHHHRFGGHFGHFHGHGHFAGGGGHHH